jgi:hypothetical protein
MSAHSSHSAWLSHQAAVQQRAAAEKETRDAQQQQAKRVLETLAKRFLEYQGRTQRLAAAFADRCWRVHELYGLYRAEWERAERAEARVKDLELQLHAASPNGHAPREAAKEESEESKP